MSLLHVPDDPTARQAQAALEAWITGELEPDAWARIPVEGVDVMDLDGVPTPVLRLTPAGTTPAVVLRYTGEACAVAHRILRALLVFPADTHAILLRHLAAAVQARAAEPLTTAVHHLLMDATLAQALLGAQVRDRVLAWAQQPPGGCPLDGHLTTAWHWTPSGARCTLTLTRGPWTATARWTLEGPWLAGAPRYREALEFQVASPDTTTDRARVAALEQAWHETAATLPGAILLHGPELALRGWWQALRTLGVA